MQDLLRPSYPGQAARIVETQVTYPLATTMLSVPGAKTVRGFSFFGDSFVYVLFEDDTDLYWARSRVLEYLNQVQGRLPPAARSSLRNARVNPSEVHYLNAHGTSTPLGDLNETNAIKLAFGDHASRLVVSSTKSMTGHLLGGAGGIESVFTVLAVHHQVSPPTINLSNQDPACDLDYCANQARPMKIDIAVKNNFGFGGTNGTLVFRRF